MQEVGVEHATLEQVRAVRVEQVGVEAEEQALLQTSVQRVLLTPAGVEAEETMPHKVARREVQE